MHSGNIVSFSFRMELWQGGIYKLPMIPWACVSYCHHRHGHTFQDAIFASQDAIFSVTTRTFWRFWALGNPDRYKPFTCQHPASILGGGPGGIRKVHILCFDFCHGGFLRDFSKLRAPPDGPVHSNQEEAIYKKWPPFLPTESYGPVQSNE